MNKKHTVQQIKNCPNCGEPIALVIEDYRMPNCTTYYNIAAENGEMVVTEKHNCKKEEFVILTYSRNAGDIENVLANKHSERLNKIVAAHPGYSFYAAYEEGSAIVIELKLSK